MNWLMIGVGAAVGIGATVVVTHTEDKLINVALITIGAIIAYKHIKGGK